MQRQRGLNSEAEAIPAEFSSKPAKQDLKFKPVMPIEDFMGQIFCPELIRPYAGARHPWRKKPCRG